jgi:hypothetical protein
MQHAPAVGVLDRITDVHEPPQQFPELQRPLAGCFFQRLIAVKSIDRLLEIVTTDEPNCVIGTAIGRGAQPIDWDDPRKLQPAGNLGFEQEPLAADRVIGVAIQDLLECDLAIELGIKRDEDGAQAAAGVRP